MMTNNEKKTLTMIDSSIRNEPEAKTIFQKKQNRA